ncbi:MULTISPECIES: DUF2188 domain-containing protein [Actinoalloteichus]|uniref:DUF2188 domain-containing protein n=1 Tax=Actinoalloteichus fjordicus TaxID=1612552 RepID=A0AAC9L6V2_9PSEU|nr:MULTISPECIES: DUF2188 domain-containing protein [Actinoalloteichus]APU12253.1 hypothetical protein UA74_00785 [Actinoalloteichus fjordicus]APU18205.1 hypothetical protein UA75_00785 [Actinoalloteichus sp. GBA129-24]
MTQRKRYNVVPHGADWQVKRGGRVLSDHHLKTAAVHEGVRAARADQDSQLLIRRRNGTIQDNRTYGHDPFPPRG